MGLIQFYYSFVPNINVIMALLFQAVGKKKKNDVLTWSDAMSAAFDASKSAQANATLLHHPARDAPLALTTDAVLEQLVHQRWQPLAFFSRSFSPAETSYSTFNRELLAVHAAIRHVRHHLEG